MGSETGEMTSIIADQVGEEGQVIGVDPDQERIKVAAQKHRGATAEYAPEMRFLSLRWIFVDGLDFCRNFSPLWISQHFC